MKIKLITLVCLFCALPLTAGERLAPATSGSVLNFIRSLDVDGPGSVADMAEAHSYIRGVDAGLFVAYECYVGIDDQTNGQLAQMWINTARANAKMWNEPNAVLRITAWMLLTSFPCKELEVEGAKPKMY